MRYPVILPSRKLWTPRSGILPAPSGDPVFGRLRAIQGGRAAAGGGAVSPTSPSDIPDLELWLRAADLVGYANNDKVPSWPDSSGNGHTFANGTSVTQPVYKTNVLNGKPGVFFTGGARLGNTDDIVGTGGDPFTEIVVVNFNNATTSGDTRFLTVSTFKGASGNAPQMFWSNQAGYANMFFGADPTGTFGAVRCTDAFASANGTFYAIGLTYNGSGPGAGNYGWYQSSVLKTTAVASTSAYSDATNWLGNIGATAFHLNGHICERLIYRRVLTSDERAWLFGTYINAEYGL